MNKRVAVFDLGELPDGAMKAVRVGSRDLLVVRRGEQIHALRDVCLHQGARLSAGVLTCTRRGGAVGEYIADRMGQIIRCPWHNWEYDAADGACLHDPHRVRVASYEAGVEDGKVWVAV